MENDKINKLLKIIESVESLESQKNSLQEEIKSILNEAKEMGFKVNIIKQIISLRKLPEEKRKQNEELLEIYSAAVGLK